MKARFAPRNNTYSRVMALSGGKHCPRNWTYLFSSNLSEIRERFWLTFLRRCRSVRAGKKAKIRNVSGETRSSLLFSSVMRNVSSLQKHPLQLIPKADKGPRNKETRITLFRLWINGPIYSRVHREPLDFEEIPQKSARGTTKNHRTHFL